MRSSTLLERCLLVVPLACAAACSSTPSGAGAGGTGTGGSSAASTGGAASSSSSASTGSSSSSGSGGAAPAGAPVVLYTDIVSGPTSGGEDDHGSYLAIFGKNFGKAGLGSTVRVRIGGVEVASYRSLGASLGRSDIEQITVQVGALGSPTPGTALPIEVAVNGVASSSSGPTFTPNPGRMLFVDNAEGDDATAVPGDITHPFQHVQLPSSTKTALGVATAGDTVVMRGSSTPYTDLGDGQDFVKVIDVGGSAPTGASGTGYLAFVAYPGETVTIVNGKGGVSDGIAFSSFDHTSGGYTGGDFVTIAGLHIEGDGTAGVIALQVASDHWRVVNNELSAPSTGGVTVLAGGVNGDGTNMAIYGNSIHDITGAGGENHGVYMDGDGSYEVAYNVIYNIASGYGIQAYDDEGSSPTISHIHVHHNLVHDVTGKGCINLADGSANDVAVWDNVCSRINLACLRFNSTNLVAAQVFNNTFYDCGGGDTYDGAIDNDSNELDAAAVTLTNNIVWAATGTPYAGGSGDGFGATGVFTDNLWYNASSPPPGAGAVSAYPLFVAAGSDFHLGSGSPAVGAGSTSVASRVTSNFDLSPLAASFDIGAY